MLDTNECHPARTFKQIQTQRSLVVNGQENNIIVNMRLTDNEKKQKFYHKERLHKNKIIAITKQLTLTWSFVPIGKPLKKGSALPFLNTNIVPPRMQKLSPFQTKQLMVP